MHRFSRLFYLLGVAGYVAALIWAVPRLPDQVASHFGADGKPDGWSTPTQFLIFGIGLGVLILVGIPLLGVLLGRGSGAGINLPHKDYWLDPRHPERRERFQQLLLEDLLCISALTGALLSWSIVEVVRANQQVPPHSIPWLPIVIYLVLILGYVIFMVGRRYRPVFSRQ